MTCRLRKNCGSGYTKTCDTVQAKEITTAMKQLQEDRNAQIAKLFPPLVPEVTAPVQNQMVKVIQRTEPPDFSNSLVSTSMRR